MNTSTPEHVRLREDSERTANWKRWGPYLSDRQWATVREDYTENGTAWDGFPHDHARSRAYRWGEDGLLGICDRECRLCFAPVLWNGRDPVLKERLFGLTGPEGNHGEDVKELYYHLDSTPTHSWMRALYKYPQTEYPYARLVEENRRRGLGDREFEIADTGVFDEGRYFDVFVTYAKQGPDHLLIRFTVANRGPDDAPLHLLPSLWFRNTWSWGNALDAVKHRPQLRVGPEGGIDAVHEELGPFVLRHAAASDGTGAVPLFTENETNHARLHGSANASPFVKDAFHRCIVEGETSAVNPRRTGTKVALHYRLNVPAGGEVSVDLQLLPHGVEPLAFGSRFEGALGRARSEADAFYASIAPPRASAEECAVIRQGYAGLLWSKQFYFYVVDRWLEGDPATPPPPTARKEGRNREWRHLYSRDILSMPDKWEYPWFAAWDTAFHMIPMARIDAAFAKHQLTLFLREWYLHPNGQIPAYEFAFSDVNPPVHAWAAWRVYCIDGNATGRPDRDFLERTFQKLLLNFTWWVNRKDAEGNNLFSGGFLGLDNIGVFDRGQPIPGGGQLRQADGTAWMAFYAGAMLRMALELAWEDDRPRPAYADMASKFFEHFIQIVDAMNTAGGTGLWDEADGFYHDQIDYGTHAVPLKTRSLVGLLPLIAVDVLDRDRIDRLPGFKKRYEWFLENRKDLARHITYCAEDCDLGHRKTLLAVPSRERLMRLLAPLLDENEFLSPYGLRSVSKRHESAPYVFECGDDVLRLEYTPGESTTYLFGGNSNWRGPVWFPINYLLIEALESYHEYYGDTLKVEMPTGSGRYASLKQVAGELSSRLGRLFLRGEDGRRPAHGDCPLHAQAPHFRDLVLFYEHFHGDNGRGLGASHQTGWTALVVTCLEDQARWA